MNNLKDYFEADNITLNVKGSDLVKFAHTLAQQVLIGAAKTKKEQPSGDTYLTTDELCAKLSISRVTAYHWERKGILNPVRFGNLKRYKLSDLEKIST